MTYLLIVFTLSKCNLKNSKQKDHLTMIEMKMTSILDINKAKSNSEVSQC